MHTGLTGAVRLYRQPSSSVKAYSFGKRPEAFGESAAEDAWTPCGSLVVTYNSINGF